MDEMLLNRLGRMALEQSPIALLLVDERFRIVHANPFAYRMLGLGQEEAEGFSCEAIMPPDVVSSHRERIKQFVQSARPIYSMSGYAPVMVRRPHGPSFPAHVGVTPIPMGAATMFLLMIADITERNEHEDVLKEKERVLDLVFSCTVDLFALYKVEGATCTLVAFNRPAMDAMKAGEKGLSKEMLLGNTRLEVVRMLHGSDAPFHESEASYAQVLSTRTPVTYEQVLAVGAKQVHLSVTLSPALDDAGRVSHILSVARDVTEYRRSERQALEDKARLEQLVDARTAELRAALVRAEDASRVKGDFLSRMSHELRTPMHAILSFAELGRDHSSGAAPERIRGFFSNIHQAGSQMLELLNDLLDLSKLDARKMVFQFESCALGEVLDEVIQVYGAQARLKKIAIEAPTSSKVRVRADRTRLAQVFRNLLSNAIKYSPEGAPLCIRVLPRPEGRLVEIAFADRGYGVPEGELSSIFERFTQSSRTRTGAGGTGLGLAICRELAHAHGGRIWAEPNPGGGTVFRFEIPMETPSGEKP